VAVAKGRIALGGGLKAARAKAGYEGLKTTVDRTIEGSYATQEVSKGREFPRKRGGP